jgi:hypothetical protein
VNLPLTIVHHRGTENTEVYTEKSITKIDWRLMPENDRSQSLIALLQLAYSAELAAAYAYRGHWHSVHDEDERARIEQIENEEWHHRELVGEMIESLGAVGVLVSPAMSAKRENITVTDKIPHLRRALRARRPRSQKDPAQNFLAPQTTVWFTCDGWKPPRLRGNIQTLGKGSNH